MNALDTNVIVRLLVNDDRRQGARAKAIFEAAESKGEAFLITVPVVLELIWVLSAVYDFSRAEVLDALELLAGMPVLEFESYERIIDLGALGRSTNADLADLLIGLAASEQRCQTTLTFEKGLEGTGLFERV